MMNGEFIGTVPSTSCSEHWLTLCDCIVCGQTPDTSPIYRCSMGHTHCYPCFKKLTTTDLPKCGMCRSDTFTRKDISADFLHKLKNKPGIGRPRRYSFDLAKRANNPANKNHIEEPVTVEQLFQMSTSKVQQLFRESSTKERIRLWRTKSVNQSSLERHTSHPDLKNEIRDEEVGTGATLEDKSSKVWLRKCNDDSRLVLNIDNSTSLPSKKPLRCPHNPCNKIIAVSSFQAHFEYDHTDFPRHSVQRGEELSVVFDSGVIEHGRSLCLAIINLREMRSSGEMTDIETFWLMVSGSPDDRPRHAYALFWLFGIHVENYKCTIELSSHRNMMVCSTVCGLNGIYDSQNISEILHRLNCLFVTTGAMRSMLFYGTEIKLRITIH